eukprot:1153530-Pelagomonas_calceolata.AAC.2
MRLPVDAMTEDSRKEGAPDTASDRVRTGQEEHENCAHQGKGQAAGSEDGEARGEETEEDQERGDVGSSDGMPVVENHQSPDTVQHPGQASGGTSPDLPHTLPSPPCIQHADQKRAHAAYCAQIRRWHVLYSAHRSHSGTVEGQLQYQLGKVAPLGPAYSSAWVCDPPQRPLVSDFRLQPSQRSHTCYSPELVLRSVCLGGWAAPQRTRPGTAQIPAVSSTSPPAASVAGGGAARPQTAPTVHGHLHCSSSRRPVLGSYRSEAVVNMPKVCLVQEIVAAKRCQADWPFPLNTHFHS